MSTYTQLLYQIVFSTKKRKPVLIKANREVLYSYIWGLFKKKHCHLYRINGVEDHIHIIAHIHPSVSIAALVKDIKISTSVMIKKENLFPGFEGWQDGYGIFSYSIDSLENLVKYVSNQEEHHREKTFLEEYRQLLEEHKIEFDEKYLR